LLIASPRDTTMIGIGEYFIAWVEKFIEPVPPRE
jgi:hypothetical protein